MAKQSTLLSVRDLYVYVSRDQRLVPIINGISFEIEEGNILGLVGESGSGKTMTCLSLLNLLPEGGYVIKGSIKLRDKELLHLSANEMRQIRGKQIAIVMQNPMAAFHPVITIGQHFVETLKAHLPLTTKRAIEVAVHYLHLMGLPRPDQLVKQYPFELSGGMLQRVMIALAISLQPSLIIADEPTTALDAANQWKIVEHLDRVRKEFNTAILLVSHDLGAVAHLADAVAVMYKGKIVEQSAVSTLFNQPRQAYTRSLLEARLALTRKSVK